MQTTFITPETIEEVCNEMAPAIERSAHLHNLPYLPIAPSLKAYALLEMNWESFVAAYRRANVTATRSGCNFTYID